MLRSAVLLFLLVALCYADPFYFNNQTTLCSSVSSPCNFANESIWIGNVAPTDLSTVYIVSNTLVYMSVNSANLLNLFVDAPGAVIDIEGILRINNNATFNAEQITIDSSAVLIGSNVVLSSVCIVSVWGIVSVWYSERMV